MTSRSDRVPFDDLPFWKQAGIRCRDKEFIAFLEMMNLLREGETAEDYVRRRCRVTSRRHIIAMSYAGHLWRDLEAWFQRSKGWRGTPMQADGLEMRP